MADLVAADVTVTVEHRDRSRKRRMHRVKVVFGDGALTYPAAGVPLPAAAKFGMSRVLESLVLFDVNDAVGLHWKFDKDNLKVRAWQAPAQTHGHAILIKGSQAAAGTAALAHYATDILGKEAATDATITEADAATKGGVQSKTLAAAALAELGNVAVAAQTMYGYAYGW